MYVKKTKLRYRMNIFKNILILTLSVTSIVLFITLHLKNGPNPIVTQAQIVNTTNETTTLSLDSVSHSMIYIPKVSTSDPIISSIDHTDKPLTSEKPLTKPRIVIPKSSITTRKPIIKTTSKSMIEIINTSKPFNLWDRLKGRPGFEPDDGRDRTLDEILKSYRKSFSKMVEGMTDEEKTEYLLKEVIN